MAGSSRRLNGHRRSRNQAREQVRKRKRLGVIDMGRYLIVPHGSIAWTKTAKGIPLKDLRASPEVYHEFESISEDDLVGTAYSPPIYSPIGEIWLNSRTYELLIIAEQRRQGRFKYRPRVHKPTR